MTTFAQFLREKNFVKPLTAKQMTALRQMIRMVNCSNCGAPIDLATHTTCGHCRSPLSMLDLAHAGELVAHLRKAAAEGAEGSEGPGPRGGTEERRRTDRATSS